MFLLQAPRQREVSPRIPFSCGPVSCWLAFVESAACVLPLKGPFATYAIPMGLLIPVITCRLVLGDWMQIFGTSRVSFQPGQVNYHLVVTPGKQE